MTEQELRALEIAKSVDARGTACPGPLLEVKKAIGKVEEDGVMEVLSADEGTRVDIPKWCGKQGHEYLGSVEENGYYKIYLRKK